MDLTEINLKYHNYINPKLTLEEKLLKYFKSLN